MSQSGSKASKFVVGACLLLVLCVLDLLLGGQQVGISEFLDSLSGTTCSSAVSTILWKLRLPRLLAAALSGAALAVSGAFMQSVFRNPLADPHIMGVSAGAGLGAAIATAFAGAAASSVLSGMTVVTAAFIGAVASTALIAAVSSSVKNTSTVLIFGVMLGFIFSALTTIVEYFASEQSVKMFYSWSSGNFSSAGFSGVYIILVSLLICLGVSIFLFKGLDIILFGDEYAFLSGANVRKIRLVSLLCCCLMTGAVTSICGPLGFVGIVSAHIARKYMSTSLHKVVVPMAALIGACFAVGADFLSVAFGTPLPSGSMMAILGAPVIVYILLSKRS